MFTVVQLPARQGWGWWRGEAHIPLAAPTPLTLPYTLLYICTVHELCSRTVGEYRLSGSAVTSLMPLTSILILYKYCTVYTHFVASVQQTEEVPMKMSRYNAKQLSL